MENLSLALANTIMTRFPDPDLIPYKDWCYVQGYVLAGLEKLWEYTGDPRYFDYIRRFVDQHVTADGQIRRFAGDSLDDVMAGTMIVAIYEKTRQERYRLAADRVRAAFDDYPRISSGGFWHGHSLPHEMWIDGVFMGGMFLTRYGAVIDHSGACFQEVIHQIQVFAQHCHKDSSGLFYHGYDESRSVAWANPATGLSPDVWSEGLGWYALILVEALQRIPSEAPGRAAVMDIFTGLLNGLCKVQDPATGLWYQVVDKIDRPDNWHDTSGSAMFVYAIQKGLDLGYVDPAIYKPVAQRGYAGLMTKAQINPDGLVDIYDACDGVCVQKSYADYIHYPKVVNAKEAVGSVLWAATIFEKPKPIC